MPAAAAAAEPRRVEFSLDQNRVFVHATSPVRRLHPYAWKRTGRRSKLANRETDTAKYHSYARALERAAHDNAIKVTQHDRAEAVMVLLGKLRHHPEHRQLWRATGRDAADEDRRARALHEGTVARLFEDLAELVTDRPEEDRLSFEDVEAVLLLR